MVDFHKKYINRNEGDADDYRISKWYTLGWGLFCIIVAMFAHNLGNSLIETVNILGSLFYGVILGIFLVAFFIKNIMGHAVFIAALLSEGLVIIIWWRDVVSFLWLNVIGALAVIFLSLILQGIVKNNKKVKL
jgi:hypothetical protein